MSSNSSSPEVPPATSNSSECVETRHFQRGLYMISTEPPPPWLTEEVLERSFEALQLERKLESQRRRELLLQKPSLREWTLQQPEEYWTELTQSWVPKDWNKRVASGEFNNPPLGHQD